MVNIVKNTIPLTSSHESDAPSIKDEWVKPKVLQNTQELGQLGAQVRDNKADIRDIKAFISDMLEKAKIDEWKVPPVQSTNVSHAIGIPLKIKTTFGKLEEDFDTISRRIVWCDELKEYLLCFEDELENHNVKYLSWFVSTLRDVFAYNYAEQITDEQLMVLKEGLEIIYDKNIRCNKEVFEEYYSKLVASGLSLLPTSSKAINEFGE